MKIEQLKGTKKYHVRSFLKKKKEFLVHSRRVIQSCCSFRFNYSFNLEHLFVSKYKIFLKILNTFIIPFFKMMLL